MDDFAEIVKRLPREIKVLKNVSLAGRWYPFLLLQNDIGILVVKPIQYLDWLFFIDNRQNIDKVYWKKQKTLPRGLDMSSLTFLDSPGLISNQSKVFWRGKDFRYQATHPASILHEQCCYLSYWLQFSESRWFKKYVSFSTLPPIRGLFFMESMLGDGDIPSEITKTLSQDFSLSSKMAWQRLLDEGEPSLVSFIVNLPPAVQGAQEILKQDIDRWWDVLAEKASDTDYQKEDRKDSQQSFQFDSLSLSGFKIYGEERTISFSPITIMLGKNNSGKSTIIQALLLLKQSLENSCKSVPLWFHEPYWDLGNFENCCHRNDNGSEKSIQFKLAFKNPLGQNRAFGFQFELTPPYQPTLVKLTYYEDPIANEGENLELPLYTFCWDNQTKMLLLKEINFEHPLWASKDSELIRQKKSWQGNPDLKKLLAEKGPTQVMLELRAFLPTKLKTSNSDSLDDPRFSHIYLTLFNELEKLSQTIEGFLKSIIYIGPNRPPIKRFYSSSNLLTKEDSHNWYMFYHDLANPEARRKVNEWLKNFKIDFEIKILRGPKFGTDIVLPRFKKPRNLNGNHKDSEESSLDSDDGSLLAFCDVGQGLTHLFPIIVTLLVKKDSFIIIEEPEVHIHPALQTCLGDLFIESIKTNHNVIFVESHSEYIIDRLQRRIAENEKITCNELNLYYLKIEEEKEILDVSSNHRYRDPTFLKIQLDEYGLFKNKIPSEFFNVGLIDSKFQIEGMLKRKQKRKVSDG